MLRFCIVILALGQLSLGVPVAAQTESVVTAGLGVVPSTVGGDAVGPLHCFDYYTFGSVEADIQPVVATTVPGSTITFVGELKSSNSYPLLDGVLYVKIFKRSETTFAQGDGNEVIEQFVIQDNITLRARGTLPVQYEWKVPANAEGGDYYAAYFFTTAKRYNLMGLSFTDDVVGNQAPFTVTTVAHSAPIAKLSKIDTTINGQNHNFASFPLHVKAGDSVVLKTTITNPTNQQRVLPLQWNQYAWDAMNLDNLRFTKTEVVTLAPNEVKEVMYEIQPQRESVVYVTAITQDIEVKSILNIRYVRDGIEETRINFPGLTAFPLEKDKEQTLFACAHSTNLPIVPGNTLTLSLKDRDGSIIHEYSYEGDIAGAMSGFGETFVPVEDINYATLTATLQRNGVIVEQVTQTYACEAIDPTSCIPQDTILSSWFNFFTTHLMTIIATLLGLIVLGIVTFLYRSRRGVPKEGIDMTTPSALLFLAILVPSLFFTVPTTTEAKSVSAGISENSGTFLYRWNFGGSQSDPNYNGWAWALRDPNFTVTYNAAVYNDVTNALISDGSTVSVGTVLRFTPASHQNSDISWYGTGYSNDSPNGYWQDPLTPPDMNCREADYVGLGSISVGDIFPDTYTFYAHMPLLINPPSKSLDLSGSTAALTSLGGDRYRVDSAGSIQASFVFGSTFGKLYYRYATVVTSWLSTPPAYSNQACTGNNSIVRYGVRNPFGARSYCSDAGAGVTKCSAGNIGSEYTLNVPARNITYSLNAEVTNNNPNPPSIAGPTSAEVNAGNSFTFTATDNDVDTIRYGITDAACTTVTEWLPGSGYVASGVSQSKNNMSWSVPGTYTLYVLAEDSKGGRSTCATHVITITDAPPITADLTINGSNGPLTVAKNTTLNIAWTSANAASCTKWGGTWGSGETVVPSGSDTTVVTATTTYLVNCAGVIDSVVVQVANQTPTVPTITYVSGMLQTNTTITFSIQGSDPDSDNIFYEIDWDNDGTVDATTMTVTSNTAQPGSRSWTTAGTQTFQARTVDIAGARSDWTSHQETLTAPTPTATLEASINGGGYSGADATINPGDTVTLRWNSTDTTTCTADSGTGFNTGGSPSGTDGVQTPNPNTSELFSATCSGTGGTVNDGITITTRQLPNFSQPAISYILSSTFDPATGIYDYIEVTFQTGNTGGSDTFTNADYELQFDRNRDGYEYTNTGALGTFSVGQVVNKTERVSGNVPFGNARIRIMADNTNTVTETDEADNVRVLDIMVPPPNPNLDLRADRYQVRNGETVTLTWSVGATYPMNCRVYGPRMDINPSGVAGTRVTQPIDAKSEYTFTCTEPTTGTVFTDRVTVETQGEFEET